MYRKRFLTPVAILVAALLLLVLIGNPDLALRALRMARQGAVEAALAAASTPAVEATTGYPLDAVTIPCPGCENGIWALSSQELQVLELTGDLGAEVRPEYRLVFDEAGFNRFFQARLAPWLPWRWDTPCRNLWFDLRDGGMVVYAEVDVDSDGGFSLPPGVPYLGISFSYVEQGQGIEVSKVIPLSPADRAGLAVGDIIYELDGAPAADAPHLPDWIQARAPGDVVALGVVREGQEATLEVELEEWTEDSRWRSLGLVLTPDVTGARMIPLGLSVEEDLYSLPKTGFLAVAVADAQRLLDDLLEQLVIVGPLEGEARVSRMDLSEDRLIIVMR